MILRASFERNLSCAFIESRLAWLKSRLACSVLIWLMCFWTAGETTGEARVTLEFFFVVLSLDELAARGERESHELFLAALDLHDVELVLGVEFAEASAELDPLLEVLEEFFLDLLDFCFVFLAAADALSLEGSHVVGVSSGSEFFFEVVDFAAEVGDDAFVFCDVQLDEFFVFDGFGFDVFGSVGVFEGVDCFFELGGGGRDGHDHDCLAVAAEGVFEEPGELRVAVGDEGAGESRVPFFVFVSESVDAVGQGEEALVDLRAFPQSDAAVFGDCAALAAGQVDQTELAALLFVVDVLAARRGVDDHLEDCVRPARSEVRVRGFGRPAPVALVQQIDDLSEAEVLLRSR